MAIKEAKEAVVSISSGQHAVSLGPQSSFIRRLQHQIAEKSKLASHSSGTEPTRRVNIIRPDP